MNLRDLFFVDTETTGLLADVHEIIEVAWIRTSADASVIKETYKARMLPKHIERAQPKALEVNGYSEEEWRKSPLSTYEEVAAQLEASAKDVVLVGQNISFDEGFLTALLKSTGRATPWHYHKVDTATLAWPAFASGKLSGLNLVKLCTFLGIAMEKAHSAESDVKSCYLAYRALMARYSTVFPAQP